MQKIQETTKPALRTFTLNKIEPQTILEQNNFVGLV